MILRMFVRTSGQEAMVRVSIAAASGRTRDASSATQFANARVSCVRAPAGDPAFWMVGSCDAKNAQRAAPVAPPPADGSVEAVDALAEAAAVDAAGDELTACGGGQQAHGEHERTNGMVHDVSPW
jgi:hypothetical protein